jgi:hypothetical protein
MHDSGGATSGVWPSAPPCFLFPGGTTLVRCCWRRIWGFNPFWILICGGFCHLCVFTWEADDPSLPMGLMVLHQVFWRWFVSSCVWLLLPVIQVYSHIFLFMVVVVAFNRGFVSSSVLGFGYSDLLV